MVRACKKRSNYRVAADKLTIVRRAMVSDKRPEVRHRATALPMLHQGMKPQGVADSVAVARSILVIAHHMLRNGTEYIEIGADCLDKLNQPQVQRRLVKRLTQLGDQVILEPLPT